MNVAWFAALEEVVLAAARVCRTYPHGRIVDAEAQILELIVALDALGGVAGRKEGWWREGEVYGQEVLSGSAAPNRSE